MELSKQVMDIRTNWAIGDAKRDEGLTTPENIRRFDNISYGPYGKENLLDIYVEKSVSGLQPTIVNIHGGGWVYGSKDIYQFYCMSLAERGFTVVNINYRLAPETRFPGAVEDINRALAFIEEKGRDYFIDKDRLILIGDSAGGQLVSHYATVFTSPEFAGLFDFELPKVAIKAVGLHCGEYDGRARVLEKNPLFAGEYLGLRDSEPSPKLMEQVDALKYMTKDFPPAFIMSAENDFLLSGVEPMRKHLEALGVPCEARIYGSKEQKEVAHVFEVNIRLPEAKQCNDDACNFYKKYV